MKPATVEHTDTRSALVAALHRYMLAAEDETSKARQARNRQVVAAYGDGVAVSHLADIMGMSHKAVYKILDTQNDSYRKGTT